MRNRLVAGMAVALLVTSACGIARMPASISSTAGVRGTDVPGNEGPCGAVRREVANPAQWDLPAFVFEPTGPGECSAPGRPVIFFGHGYVASFTEGYQAFMEHLVSRGFVVVYPGYSIQFDPAQQYRAEDAGFVAGIESMAPGRVDLDRIGFVGHSFGAGMIPRMIQHAAARGWGADVLWAVSLSPAWAFEVGDGPIDVPAHTRFLTISYENDVFVDTQVATEMLGALTVPDSQKHQLLIHSSGDLVSSHLLPITLPIGSPLLIDGSGLGVDHFDRWATWRPIDAWSRCALDGVWCDTDLADMGPGVVRATQGLGLPDTGPGALVECASWLSPRRCW